MAASEYCGPDNCKHRRGDSEVCLCQATACQWQITVCVKSPLVHLNFVVTPAVAITLSGPSQLYPSLIHHLDIAQDPGRSHIQYFLSSNLSPS